jgi:hypothetical protein
MYWLHLSVLRVKTIVQVFEHAYKLLFDLGGWHLAVRDDVGVLFDFTRPERAVGVCERGVSLLLRPALCLAFIVEGLAVRRRAGGDEAENES